MKKVVLAVSAAFLAVFVIVATQAAVDDSAGVQSAGPVPGSPTGSATGASLPTFDLPTVDHTLDLDTGLTTPLPEAILNSLGPAYVGTSIYDRAMARYALSPDGSKLAYIGARGKDPEDQTPQLFVAGIDGTGIRQLTRHPPICCPATPAWSPDGTRIVIDSPQGIYVVDVATGTLTQVVGPEEEYQLYKDPTFSPDGTRIIYSNQGIRTVPVAGGPSTLLFGSGTGGMRETGNASVSPDGTLVTMMGNLLTGGCCYRVLGNIDGTDMKPLGSVDRGGIHLWGSNASGTWSPNGDRIVTHADIDGIAVTDVTTGRVEIVARGNGAIWLDDHTLLVEVS